MTLDFRDLKIITKDSIVDTLNEHKPLTILVTHAQAADMIYISRGKPSINSFNLPSFPGITFKVQDNYDTANI